MDNHTLRNLMGPILGYDYNSQSFGGDGALLARHRTQLLLKGGNTRHYHTMRTITENTVAEHSWGVAALMYVLSAGLCTAEGMMAALTHDVAEVFVGDVPSPTKRALNMFDQLQDIEDAVLHTAQFVFDITAEEQRWLKMADCMDGMLFAIRERTLGNQRCKLVYERFRQYVLELSPQGVENEVLHTLDQEWGKVNHE